jgi:regulator of sigma E protease
VQGLITFFTFAVTIGILVGFHEYGHYAAARMCGVRVLRFAIGFGKPLFRFTSQNKTEWVIGLIPLGGYVKLLDGRDPEQQIDVANEANAFDRKPLWQRSFIVAAGPLANFILAIAFLMVIYLAGAAQLPARLQAPPEASVAAKVGLVAGDVVTGWRDIDAPSADFEPVISWNQLRWQLLDAITGEKGFVLELTSPSGGRIAVPFPADALPQVQPKQDPLQALGIRPASAKLDEMVILRLGPIDALIYASERVWLITVVSAKLMLGLVTGETSLNQLGGPLSIADMAGKSAQVGWQAFFGFLALMSISIGLLNLIPIPMLDGGQLLYDAWELISGKRLPISVQEWLHKFSFILLISLTLFALFNDLQRYFLS